MPDSTIRVFEFGLHPGAPPACHDLCREVEKLIRQILEQSRTPVTISLLPKIDGKWFGVPLENMGADPQSEYFDMPVKIVHGSVSLGVIYRYIGDGLVGNKLIASFTARKRKNVIRGNRVSLGRVCKLVFGR